MAPAHICALNLCLLPSALTLANPPQVFGEYGWNWISPIGPNTAIVLVDSRTERSRSFIVHPASYVMIQKRIAALPPGIKHVVVLTTVPVIYPTIPAAETSLSAMSGEGWLGRAMMMIVNIKHVVVVTTMHVTYPPIPAAETSLSAMSGEGGLVVDWVGEGNGDC